MTSKTLGTWAREPDGATLVLYSPLTFFDGAVALRERRGDFRVITTNDPAWLPLCGTLQPGEWTTGDNDPGDEAEADFVNRDALAEMDAAELRQIISAGGPAALVDAATARLREIYPSWGLLDDLAATARTALADPAAVGLDDPDHLLADRHASNDDVIDCLSENANYAVGLLDQIINTLNPAELDAAGAARALRVLGRQIGDLRDRMVKENLLDVRSLIVDMLDDVTDRILVDAADELAKAGDQS